MSMRIDLTCPVEAWKVILPTEENPACEVTLFNLSSLQVVSVEVTILLSSGDGEETAKLTHRGRSLNGAPGKTFHMSVPVEGHITPERYEITVDKVWYDNSSVWRREKENMISYEPNNLRRSAQLTTLRSIVGDMASGYPDQQEGLWVCVCGRPNLDETTLCARCHRDKAEVFAKYSRQAIDAIVAAKEEALAEHGRETLKHTSRKFADEKDFVRRKKHYGWLAKLLAGLIVLAGLVWAGEKYAWPAIQYELATRASEEGRFAEASQSFAKLGDYKDAAHQAKYTQLVDEHLALSGTETLNDAEYLSHSLVLDVLEDFSAEIGEKTVSAEGLMQQAKWQHAEFLFGEGRYDEAEVFLTALGDQYEAPERLTEIAYIRACALLENGQWNEARTAFEALGEYKDSASLRLDTWYTPAV